MASVYEYYKDLCRCPGTSMPGAGENESYFDYYGNYCICDGSKVYLGLRDLDDIEVSTWPVTAYNVNEVAIGAAASKEQYISVWNSDPDNQAVGVLSGGVGPFLFILTLNPGQISPPWVLGEPDDVHYGIYEEEYDEEEYE